MGFARLATLLAILGMVAAAAATAVAASDNVATFHSNGSGATADLRWTDGCVRSIVFISVSEGRRGRGSAGGGVDLRDTCTGELLVFASGSTQDAAVSIAPRLNGAAAQGVIPMLDLVSGATINVAFDVAWTPSGPLTRDRDHYSLDDGEVTDITHFINTSREATATGTASDGTTVLLPPGTSGPGFLAWANSGETIITMHQ